MHVHFTAGEPGEARLLLDDVDITAGVMREGFAITVDDNGRPVISMRVCPDLLTVDGQAVVQATQISQDEVIAAAVSEKEAS